MRAPTGLIYLLVALLAWKVVRADWIVEAPYWYGDTDGAGSVWYGPYPVPLPISPLWRPPEPHEINLSITTQWRDPARHPSPNKSWEEFFPGSGAAGISGPPRLHPNWRLIAFKLIGGFIVLYPTVILISYVHRRLTKVSTPAFNFQ